MDENTSQLQLELVVSVTNIIDTTQEDSREHQGSSVQVCAFVCSIKMMPIKYFLLRFFEREVNFGVKLLQTVRQDLEEVVAITSSGKKQTNHHRSLIATLTRGMIPVSWMRYKVPTSCSVAAWVTDFSSRVKQLSAVSKAVSSSGASQLKCFNVWMGGKLAISFIL